jgi:hypothetical protein
MASVYIRAKSGANWRYQRIEEGPGKKTGALSGPFFARPTVNGKQIWHKLGADTFQKAKAESELAAAAVDAARQGLTVTEADALANRSRISIRSAVDAYLDLKRGKRPKTIGKYTNTLTCTNPRTRPDIISASQTIVSASGTAPRSYHCELHSFG